MPRLWVQEHRVSLTVAEFTKVLPPIHRNEFVPFTEPVAIDCEWDEDTGALTLVGVGNLHGITQLWWQELRKHERFTGIEWLFHIVKSVPVIYHNADADIRKLRENYFASLCGDAFTVEIHQRLEDTMLAHSVLHCEEEHTLEYCCTKYGKLPPHKQLKTEDLSVYNAADIVQTLFVWAGLEVEFTADPAAERVYREERLPMIQHIIHDEERGIRVNQSLVYPLRDEYEARRHHAQRLALAHCGWPLNLGSPDQLKARVYGVEGFPTQYHAKTEEPTLDKDALAKLRRLVFTEWDADDEPTLEQATKNIEEGGHPLLEARYLYFGAQQTLSHYLDHCFAWEGDTITGVLDRIYPETRQHVQTSGRQSIVGPAMQQLKGRVERMVHPDPGTVWLGWDWSNIETWILGALAGDSLILEAKAKGWDTHTVNYCDIANVSYPSLLTKALHTAPECAEWRERLKWQGEDDQRRVFAKRYVYRLHYRGQPENAGDIPGARALNFDARRLVEASENYLGKHPAIVEYWTRIDDAVDTQSVVYAFMGMPRRLTSPYKNARYREASNHPMQAGVAHIYNRTRLLIHRALSWLEFMYGKHDSQWWQCPEDRVEEAWAVIKPIVQRYFYINGMHINFPASFKERRPE